MKYVILFLVTLLCFSCKKEDVLEEQFIVRVGSSVLKEKDLINILGADASSDQKLNYIRRWSDNELAYQAALENGLDKEESVKRTIENMKKDFLSIQFIQQEIGKASAVEVFADEIQNEFRDNLHLYLRKEPVIKVAKIVVESKLNAWKVREGLTAENFRARGNPYSLEEVPPYDSIKFATKKDFNIETWNTLFTTRVTSVSLPIEEDGNFSIYLILAKENAGSQPLLEEIIDDVKRNVLTKKQNDIVENIYRDLRNKENYFYDSEYIANLEKNVIVVPDMQKEDK